MSDDLDKIIIPEPVEKRTARKNDILTAKELLERSKQMEARRKETKKDLHPFIQYLFGKSVLIYGESFQGKSTFIARLAGRIHATTGKKSRFYWLDKNFRRESFGKSLERISKADVIYVRYPRRIHRILEVERSENGWRNIDFNNYAMVVVDSLTGIATELTKSGTPDSPQVTLATVRYAQAIMSILADIAHDYGCIAILVAHPTQLMGDEWMGEKQKPSFMGKAMMNADIILHFYSKEATEKSGAINVYRFVKVIADRVPFGTVNTYAGKVFDTEELLS